MCCKLISSEASAENQLILILIIIGMGRYHALVQRYHHISIVYNITFHSVGQINVQCALWWMSLIPMHEHIWSRRDWQESTDAQHVRSVVYIAVTKYEQHWYSYKASRDNLVRHAGHGVGGDVPASSSHTIMAPL